MFESINRYKALEDLEQSTDFVKTNVEWEATANYVNHAVFSMKHRNKKMQHFFSSNKLQET